MNTWGKDPGGAMDLICLMFKPENLYLAGCIFALIEKNNSQLLLFFYVPTDRFQFRSSINMIYQVMLRPWPVPPNGIRYHGC